MSIKVITPKNISFGPEWFKSVGLHENILKTFSNRDWTKELDAALRSVAAGGYTNQLQTFLKGLDRYQRNILPPNSEHSGLTFITRPRLNLQSANLRQDRCFAPLDGDPEIVSRSMQHMIRCLLDTRFCKDMEYKHPSPFVDTKNPFFTPLCNALNGISGFPDPIIETLTTDVGFHSEDQTFAIGHDNLNKSYDLSLSFKDIQYGPICAILYYWLKYMANVVRGTMLAYSDDIDNQRMNYTVSIYRFVMDPSRRFITRFAKATGCFPKSVPLGAMFNFAEGELFVSSSGRFTIPFVANKIEYNDYGIISDFNRLTTNYWKDIVDPSKSVETGDYIDISSIRGGNSVDFFVAKSKEHWIREFSKLSGISSIRDATAYFDKRVTEGSLVQAGSDNYSGRPFVDTSRADPTTTSSDGSAPVQPGGPLRLSFRIGIDELKL